VNGYSGGVARSLYFAGEENQKAPWNSPTHSSRHSWMEQTDRLCVCMHACSRVCPLHGRTDKEIGGARQGYQTRDTPHARRDVGIGLFSFCHARPIAHIVWPVLPNEGRRPGSCIMMMAVWAPVSSCPLTHQRKVAWLCQVM
jgi:hypothetical protein